MVLIPLLKAAQTLRVEMEVLEVVVLDISRDKQPPAEVGQPIKATMEETAQILIVLEVAGVLVPLAHLGVPAQRILVVLVVMALLQQ